MKLKGKKSLAIIRGDNPLLIGIMELQIAIAELGRGENQKALMNIESARRFVKNITEKNISEYQEKKIAEMKLNFETEQKLIEFVQFVNNMKTENERLMQQVTFDEMIGELVMQNVKVPIPIPELLTNATNRIKIEYQYHRDQEIKIEYQYHRDQEIQFDLNVLIQHLSVFTNRVEFRQYDWREWGVREKPIERPSKFNEQIQKNPQSSLITDQTTSSSSKEGVEPAFSPLPILLIFIRGKLIGTLQHAWFLENIVEFARKTIEGNI